jgi:hypothetical protein
MTQKIRAYIQLRGVKEVTDQTFSSFFRFDLTVKQPSST